MVDPPTFDGDAPLLTSEESLANLAIGDAFAIHVRDGYGDDLAAARRSLGTWLCGAELGGEEARARASVLELAFVDHIDEIELAGSENPHSFSTDPASHRVAAIPLHDVGERPTLICERGVWRVPFLKESVRLGLARRGVLALPAGAVARDEQALMVAGVDRLATAGLVAGLVAAGYGFLAGAGLLTSLANKTVIGNDGSFQISVDLLRNYPGLARQLGRAEVLRGRTWSRLAKGFERATRRPSGEGLAPRIGRKLPQAALRRARATIDPAAVYGVQGSAARAQLRSCFLLEPQRAAHVAVSDLGSESAARRLTGLVLEDLDELLRAYRRQRFADSAPPAPWIRSAENRVREWLEELLEGVECTLIRYPRGVWQLELVDLISRHFA